MLPRLPLVEDEFGIIHGAKHCFTHKKSGIKNDPNDWAMEMGNPRYILDLLLSIINVSVQTVDIVEELPKLKFE